MFVSMFACVCLWCMCMFIVRMCEYVYMHGAYVCNVHVWCVVCVCCLYVCEVWVCVCMCGVYACTWRECVCVLCVWYIYVYVECVYSVYMCCVYVWGVCLCVYVCGVCMVLWVYYIPTTTIRPLHTIFWNFRDYSIYLAKLKEWEQL